MKQKLQFLTIFFITTIFCNISIAQIMVSTLAGSPGSSGNTNGTGSAARFNLPNDLVTDATGNIYVADRVNHLIRKITPTGDVTTFAGSGVAGNTDGTGTAASFNNPNGIAIDATGNLYIADLIDWPLHESHQIICRVNHSHY